MASYIFPYIFFIAGTKFVLFIFAIIELLSGFFAINYVSFICICII